MKPYLVVLRSWSVEAVAALVRFNAVPVTPTCWVIAANGSAKSVGVTLSNSCPSLIHIHGIFELAASGGDFAITCDSST